MNPLEIVSKQVALEHAKYDELRAQMDALMAREHTQKEWTMLLTDMSYQQGRWHAADNLKAMLAGWG